MFSFFFYSEPVIREYAHVTRIHAACLSFFLQQTCASSYPHTVLHRSTEACYATIIRVVPPPPPSSASTSVRDPQARSQPGRAMPTQTVFTAVSRATCGSQQAVATASSGRVDGYATP